MANSTYCKIHSSAIQLCNAAGEEVKKLKFTSALEFYTLGLLYAPATTSTNEQSKATKKLSETFEKCPLTCLYSGRSLAMFRMKRYEDCVNDIKRACASGKQDDTSYMELVNRLAWSYWHLKDYGNCSKTLESAKKTTSKTLCKELQVLDSMLAKSRAVPSSRKDSTASNASRLNAKHLNYFGADVYGGEHNEMKGVTSYATWNYNPAKGRFLTANKTIKPGSVVIDEEAFSAVLSSSFIVSHCNYCFKECKLFGISCCGCSKALYCDEECRLLAWKSYHWLECCMWPIIKELDIYCHLALRTLLCAAFQMSDQDLKENGEDCFTLVAEHLHAIFNDVQAKGKKKNTRKTVKQQMTPNLDGRNPKSNVYMQDYWSVYCLQSHENEHAKPILTKATLCANYIAKALSEFPLTQRRKAHRQPSHGHGDLHNTAQSIESVFVKLCLKNFCGQLNDSNTPDMESFRAKVLEVCNNMAADAPVAKLKQQSCYLPKDIPRSFQDIVSFLLRRHILQLYTNCQAVYDVVEEGSKNDGELTLFSQQRIAFGIFPSTSLLNHSCNCNTSLNFIGRRILVRAVTAITNRHEIAHCYGPAMSRFSFADRQKMLKDQYYFDCTCTACSKFKSGDTEDQVFFQQFTAYKCQSCEGPILILDNKTQSDGVVHGKCANEACKRVYDLTEAYESYNRIVVASSAIANRLQKNFNDKDLALLEDCLSEMKKILFHHHHAISSFHDQLGYYYSFKKDYIAAARHVTASLKVTSMRYGSESIEAAHEMFKLATLYFNCEKTSEAEKLISKYLKLQRKLSTVDMEEVMKAEAMLLAIKTYNITKDLKKP